MTFSLRKTSILSAAIAACLAAPLTVPTSQTGMSGSEAIAAQESLGPEVSSFFLNNGLQVVVIPDRRAPVVTHMLWYRAGAADEPPGKSGIAHFLEHLMFKGTDEIPDGAFSKIVAANGGQVS